MHTSINKSSQKLVKYYLVKQNQSLIIKIPYIKISVSKMGIKLKDKNSGFEIKASLFPTCIFYPQIALKLI